MRDRQEPEDYQGYAGHTELDGYDFEDGGGGDAGGDPGAPRRSGARKAVLATVGGVFAALLAVGGYGLHTIVTTVQGGSSSGGSGGSQASGSATQTPQAPATAEEAAAVTTDFLAAWGRGDVTAASALTSRPEAARAALAAFQENVPARTLALTATGPAGGAAGGTAGGTDGEPLVGFRVKAEFEGATGAWEYDSTLGVVRGGSGKALVHWTPAVLHPHLAQGGTIAVKALPDPVSKPTDRNGKPLEGFPSLAAVLPRITPADGGTVVGGRAVVLSAAGKEPEQLYVLTPPSAPQVKLTLDAELQRVAEEAIKQQAAGGKPASLVAIQPSTGHILAMAYSPSGHNRAVSAGQAPGSTMKVITSAALLEAGVTPDTVVPCKDTTNSPRQWHNDERGDFPSYTLADDFSHSCNTGFIDKGLEKLQPGTLAKVARDQFGLGLEWHIGIDSRDATIPVPRTNDEAAAEYIGQGTIQVNSLAMASVAATVQNGTFRQPVLRADAKRVTAPGSLPAGVAKDLRAMMARTATQGTARTPMAGLTGQIGAKTGTAESGGTATNSWFIAYRGDLAVAAEVDGGGHGFAAAGVAAAQVLKAGGKG
ncbi:Penicillin binding protein transpeptidase domain-containing protein [Streptomyces sp. TLI_053]|uniref:penicillin-binding transpeptidase domain-containing protein n=1 Tax=Streptomyces sp. TLI_053 TaxID=1855352 RepID=UPI00087C7E7E|nr:penicillin-binding transpeptidase domain-containing protein [Streptomyces sp. TLI_053]SDS66667.1 Penicillin binding protein transpeptidase domain-containing protein [Streptomyces sp. TLI_053]